MNSPGRLGVSPAAASTPRGEFSQRIEALFHCAGALGCILCFAPCPSSWFIYARMWGRGGATCCSACPILCHSESRPLGLSVPECRAAGSASPQTACPVCPTLLQSRSHHSKASRLRPGCWSGWMLIFLSPWCRTSLLFNFLSVLVVQGGAVCLPMPPSWFSLHIISCSGYEYVLSPLIDYTLSKGAELSYSLGCLWKCFAQTSYLINAC